MASKKARPKFTGPLNEPIVIPLDLPAFGGTTFEIKPHGLIERMEKLSLLAEHYQTAQNDWMTLVLKLAEDFVPGFQIVYDDPLAATLGLPRAGGAKANRAGANPELWGPRLLAFVALVRSAGAPHGLYQSDRACAEIIFDTTINYRIAQSQRTAGVRTVLRRIAEAKKRELGAATITRSKSKSN